MWLSINDADNCACRLITLFVVSGSSQVTLASLLVPQRCPQRLWQLMELENKRAACSRSSTFGRAVSLEAARYEWSALRQKYRVPL